jgi:hypothetical protein
VPIRNIKILQAGILTALCLLFCTGITFAQSGATPDAENCLFCHRYPSMGRYDKNGNKRVFYINDQMFAKSVHGKLRCKNCHVDLDKIPHTDVKKVDCSTKCHLKEPSTNQEFSHINMVEKYRMSVHGEGAEGNQKKFSEDRPTCKYCHDNRTYNPYSGFWGKSEALSNETLARCMGCHTKKDWAERFYSHFTHRMRKRRQQKEIVKLCTSCHEDGYKMARHGLESISTYKDTFHWALVKYEVKDAPDCISCHVPVGYSTHEIHPQSDQASPVHNGNRVNTCSNQGGIQTCHPRAMPEFSEGRVHAYGMKAQLAGGISITESKDKIDPLLLARAREDITKKELFHYKVLKLIRLFYKILIAGVIGFMSLHQLVDYRRTRKNMKK